VTDLSQQLRQAQARALDALRDLLTDPLVSLAPAERTLLRDGSGDDTRLRQRLLAHAAEARVAERVLRARGGRAWERRGGASKDLAARLLTPLPTDAKRRLTREIDRVLADADAGEAPLPPARTDTLLFPSAFPERAAKRRGAVYTDPELVELLLDLAGWDGQGRLLEPAVGAGAFLLAAWRRTVVAGQPASLDARDVHPFACRAARSALALQALELSPDAPRPRITCGDALGVPARPEYDVVVGNPPWVRGERIPAASRAAYRERFPDLGQGNVDLYAYFLRQGLEWLKPGGRLAFVIPQGLFEARSAAGLRAVLAEHTIEAVVSLEWATGLFPGAATIPALLVVRRAPLTPGHHVRLGVAEPGPFARERVRWSQVDQAAWLALGRQGRWPLLLRRDDLGFLHTLDRCRRPLTAGYGLSIRTRTGAQALIGDGEQAAHFQAPRPLLDGREVRAWSLDWGGRWLDYLPEAISDAKSEAFFRSPKVLLPRIALTTQAAVDETDGFMARNTVMVLRAPGTALDDHPHALAALVNALPTRVYAFLLLRAGALAGSHRATFYAGVAGDVPVPEALLREGPALEALDTLGRQARAAAQASDRDELAEIERQVDAAVARAFGLDDAALAALRARAAEQPLRSVLTPKRAGDPTRRIGVQAYAAGQRYR
jgi:methylase of polypeptide subunit release factors